MDRSVGSPPAEHRGSAVAKATGRTCSSSAVVPVGQAGAMTTSTPDGPWFAVRCVFRSPDAEVEGASAYEERITLWRSETFEDAIDRAESEAATYAAANPGTEYLDLAQAFQLGVEGAVGDGDEVFSLIRDSDLDAEAYLDRFFDDGEEYQDEVAQD